MGDDADQDGEFGREGDGVCVGGVGLLLEEDQGEETMEASPRGPNQPMKKTVVVLMRLSMGAMATGRIRTTVRLRIA